MLKILLITLLVMIYAFILCSRETELNSDFDDFYEKCSIVGIICAVLVFIESIICILHYIKI